VHGGREVKGAAGAKPLKEPATPAPVVAHGGGGCAMVAQRDGDDRDAAARRCRTTPRPVQGRERRFNRGGVAHPTVGCTEGLIGVLIIDRRSAAEHSIYSFGQPPW